MNVSKFAVTISESNTTSKSLITAANNPKPQPP